jgi:hypothetical protein
MERVQWWGRGCGSLRWPPDRRSPGCPSSTSTTTTGAGLGPDSERRWVSARPHRRGDFVRGTREAHRQRATLADTIVFVDLPRRVCLSRAMRRVRSPILQAPGCPQKVDREFLRWIWAFPKDTRPKVLSILGRHAPTTDIVHLRSRVDVWTFLSRLRRRSVDLTGWTTGPSIPGPRRPEPGPSPSIPR